MKKLIVVAEKEELKLIGILGPEVKGIPVLVTGVGALNVINALKDIPRDTKIINIGYAGSKNLEPNQFYGVNSSTLYHPNVNYDEPVYDMFCGLGYPCRKCYTGCDFVLSSNYENCLFDMELAYINALGFRDVVAYKYVSDNLGLQEYRNNAGLC